MVKISINWSKKFGDKNESADEGLEQMPLFIQR
jgi:hypothetical protein